MAIKPVHPLDRPDLERLDPAPGAGARRTGSRRTFGRNLPSRRTFGKYNGSRRTFGRNFPSRRSAV